MAISQSRSKRKATGGRYIDYKKEKQYELGREPAHTHLQKQRKQSIRVMGGNQKLRLLSANTTNLLDPKTKKFKQVKIKTITDNPASRQFIRRNIMTKGAIIDTELGKAKITSRPGQDGIINSVLIS